MIRWTLEREFGPLGSKSHPQGPVIRRGWMRPGRILRSVDAGAASKRTHGAEGFGERRSRVANASCPVIPCASSGHNQGKHGAYSTTLDGVEPPPRTHR